MKLSPSVQKEFTKVTSLSKFIAGVLFIVFPFVGFFLGMQYQHIIYQNQELIDVYKWDSYKTEQIPVQTIFGVYSGILPCDDCEGKQTEAILFVDSTSHAPRTFILKETFLGKSPSVVETKGNWNIEIEKKTDRNIYRLTPDNGTTSLYFEKQSEDTLVALDQNGKQFTSKKNYSLVRE